MNTRFLVLFFLFFKLCIIEAAHWPDEQTEQHEANEKISFHSRRTVCCTKEMYRKIYFEYFYFFFLTSFLTIFKYKQIFYYCLV